jgi:hypothetical protein
LGRVFSICNPFRWCPRAGHPADQARLTPKQLFRYKKSLMSRKNGTVELLQAHMDCPLWSDGIFTGF